MCLLRRVVCDLPAQIYQGRSNNSGLFQISLHYIYYFLVHPIDPSFWNKESHHKRNMENSYYISHQTISSQTITKYKL